MRYDGRKASADLATGRSGLVFWRVALILAVSLVSSLTACGEESGQGDWQLPTAGQPPPGGQPPIGGQPPPGGQPPIGGQPPAGGQSGAPSDGPQNAGAGGGAGQDPLPPVGGTNGAIDAGPPQPLDAGTSDGNGIKPPPTTDSGSSADAGPAADTGSPNPNDDLDALRQVCVDYINEYRASIGLAPLSRATPEQEACSDRGAQQDGTTGQAHSSAGSCPGLGGQNTCPNYTVGGWSGNTLEDSMKYCLDQMWAEGPPPVPIDQCRLDYVGCVLVHGHYINMSNESYSVVACGFYETSPGTWWMNQDFGY